MRTCLVLLVCLCICYASSSQTITGSPALTVCAPQNVTLTVNPIAATYQWESGPTNTGPWTNVPGGNTQNITVSTSAWYHVIVTGPAGTSPAVHVIVNPLPTASFTFNPNNQCSTVPVNFNNTS